MKENTSRSKERFLSASMEVPSRKNTKNIPCLPDLTHADLDFLVGGPAKNTNQALFLLNEAAKLYLLNHYAGPSSAEGEIEHWAVQVRGYATSLLFALGMAEGDPRMPDAARHLLQEPIEQTGGSPLIKLLHKQLRESFALHTAVDGVRLIALAADEVATKAEREKRQGRSTDLARYALFNWAIDAYEAATERPAKRSTNSITNEPRGPLIRFMRRFLSILEERLRQTHPEAAAGLKLNDGKIAAAIRSVQSGIAGIPPVKPDMEPVETGQG